MQWTGNDWMIVQEDEQQNVKIIVVKVFAAYFFLFSCSESFIDTCSRGLLNIIKTRRILFFQGDYDHSTFNGRIE